MKDRQRFLWPALVTLSILGGCGGGGGNDVPGVPAPPYYQGELAPFLPNASGAFSFDISWMDNTRGLYYLADRTNKGVDVFDTKKQAFVTTIGPAGAFTGFTGNNGTSGPNGVTTITGTLAYAGDVNKLVVVDGVAKTVVTSVSFANATVKKLGGTGLRTDEGCFDPVHKRYIIATPEADGSVVGQSPFLTVFDTTNASAPVITGYITFFDPTDPGGLKTTAAAQTTSLGLEQCAYDSVNDQFLINNDGTVANPDGEVDHFAASAVAAIAGGAVVNDTALTGYGVFGIGGTAVQCNGRGLDLGPGTTPATAEFAINCSSVVGKPMVTQIMNRATGAILATAKVGGGDQLTYDATTNRYYVTGSSWNPTGIKAGKTTPITPVLGVVAATTGTVIALLPAGQSAHSVTVDAVNHLAFAPHTIGSALAQNGAPCGSCTGGFATSGISVYVTQ